MDELLRLTRENNEMLKYVVAYIQHEQNDGLINDFLMNIVANQFNFNRNETNNRI